MRSGRAGWSAPALLRAALGACAILAVMILLPALADAAPDKAERRVALVIGISAYQNAPTLANPVNDARAIGEALRRLNFEVYELFDPDYRGFSRGLRDFGVRVQSADTAVIYYAGHGVQADHENYLLPADAKLEHQHDLLFEAIPLRLLLGEMVQASKIGIILLDACRNNPFTDRMSRSFATSQRAIATGAGLARVDDVPRNTMVVMATKADQGADDGDAGHSPFAEALLAHLQIPGLELGLFFRSVRDTVLKATNNRQEPYIFSSLGAEPFYFRPRPPNHPPEIGPVTALQVADRAGPTPLGIPQPTDPDGDALTVRIIGLPRSGEVRIDGRPVRPNDLFPAEKFTAATFKPDGKMLGPVGSVDILVEDGRGGSAMGTLPIAVTSSNHPPVVDRAAPVRFSPVRLGIPLPSDPDGDPLTVTVTALPHGRVRNGGASLSVGDRLQPADLPRLTFVPDADVAGRAGTFGYVVEDGRGGRTEGAVEIEVADAAAAVADVAPEALLWDRVRQAGAAEELDAFLRLYPRSRFAGEASRQRDKLAASAVPMARPEEPRPQADTKVASLPPVLSLLEPQRDPAKAAALRTPAAPAAPAPPAAPSKGAAEARTLQDCPTCPRLAVLSGGSFIMGQGTRDPAAMPPHPVAVRPFAIGLYPVTVGDWRACLAEDKCDSMPRMAEVEDRTPVHNVSWNNAQNFVAWLRQKTGKKYRLPSEAEWEYAARGGTATRYWWGDQVGVARANCVDCGGQQDARRPLPVDALPANPFGLYHMLGGVAQWTEDCWFPDYRGAPADGTAREAPACMKRVLRGGSFRAGQDDITATSRNNYDASVRYIVNGFRVARDVD